MLLPFFFAVILFYSFLFCIMYVCECVRERVTSLINDTLIAHKTLKIEYPEGHRIYVDVSAILGKPRGKNGCWWWVPFSNRWKLLRNDASEGLLLHSSLRREARKKNRNGGSEKRIWRKWLTLFIQRTNDRGVHSSFFIYSYYLYISSYLLQYCTQQIWKEQITFCVSSKSIISDQCYALFSITVFSSCVLW